MLEQQTDTMHILGTYVSSLALFCSVVSVTIFWTTLECHWDIKLFYCPPNPPPLPPLQAPLP